MDEWFRENPDADLKNFGEDDKTICFSSGNWRGYVATFSIEGARLILRKIEISSCGDRPGGDALPSLFDGKKEVPVDWFSGILIVPIGKRIAYAHLGYGSLYSEYRLFRIEAGRVVAETKMDSEQYARYRERQFEAHKQTSAYVQALAETMQDGDWSREDAEAFLYNVDSEYPMQVMLDF